ncbi:chitin synthase, class IV, partial [Aureobasidium melanogenum]
MHHRRTSSHSKPEPEPYVSRIASPVPRITSPSDYEPMMGASDLGRKKSLIRPERTKVDRDHPQYHYRKHAQNMAVMPSTTGHDPMLEEAEAEAATLSSDDIELKQLSQKGRPADVPVRRSGSRKLQRKATVETAEERKKRQKQAGATPPTLWSTYCHLITFWCPNPVLKCFGMPEKAQQQAWREKMGLISIILMIAAFVGFITFGFTATVCPSGSSSRFRVNKVDSGYMIFHGKAYDLTRSKHPQARGIQADANVLWDLSVPYGGKDGSFMFQNVNGACKGLVTAAPNSDVKTDSDGNLAWYFPCNAFNQDGSTEPNLTIPYYLGYACHTSKQARTDFYGLKSGGDVYFTWDDIKNSSRNLMVYGGDVLDLNLLRWFNTSQVSYPSRFDEIRENANIRGTDMSLAWSSGQDKKIAKCFQDIIKVGSIDTETVGCIASKIVLYVALVFILSIVVAKFVLALAFQWFLCRRYAADKTAFSGDEKKRNQQIEEWADDIYRPAPKIADSVANSSERANKRGSFLPTTSRFTSPYAIERSMARSRPAYTTMASQSSTARLIPGASVYGQGNRSENTLQESRASLMVPNSSEKRYSSVVESDGPGPHGFIHEAVVPQPPPEWQPFGFPLAHAICLVTAYSEGPEGMRTTLDSVATTEYPNSHKLILVICDGIIKGHGETMTTPEVALSMMKEHTILPDEVKPYSYVAVASGSKRHNMAKIYSGFYDYGEDSVIPIEKQERVPMVIIVKCGTPEEATQAKPGNRGKRDSQIILMSFLQKVMFDERMTELEYEFFNGIWKITGISPDFYEIVLMVDADTKVFPDSLTHMISAMVKDPEIMGLCGETKIANKRASWVSMIQVFEYFISHHQSKSFESVFGGVTCLPGCFCMYRIKAPKGDQNYWVPILANPDIVEHYSENVVDTLHKKNLLLLGEDRYLSTLMLRTFPKRKQVFVPQAVCKTTVPDEFKVLLSQRRRWINSTVHNLMELVLVRDLCGTFCFSMQFVVFVELVGTLVLPAAIAFTFYVIAVAIKAAVEHTTIPVMSLVLLALILGLPGVLIILTAHRISYVAWMLIYLLSLPVWNFILPTYAYWKFDDFSWGDTRKTAGEQTKGGHDDAEGEFDSSKITMKRWADFEHERRMKTGGTNYNSSAQGSYPYESGYEY